MIIIRKDFNYVKRDIVEVGALTDYIEDFSGTWDACFWGAGSGSICRINKINVYFCAFLL